MMSQTKDTQLGHEQDTQGMLDLIRGASVGEIVAETTESKVS